MCDEAKLKSWAADRMTRRGFGVIAGSAAVAACAPNDGGDDSGTDASGADGSADSGVNGANGAGTRLELTESPFSLTTADGTMDGFFVHPATGAHPGVIFWPDIASVRESKRNMARRLAGEGYSVLVLNPYYRDVAGEQFADFAEFIDADGFAKVKPWRDKLNAYAIGRDTNEAIAWLDAQDVVDPERGIGAQGYCMGGPFAIWSAEASDRVAAAASFHGGGLVREDDPLSPHKILHRTQAAFLIAVAQDDDADDPEAKSTFAKAAQMAGRPAKVEVYAGDHGWTVPDSPAYARAAAERAYADLLKLYGANL